MRVYGRLLIVFTAELARAYAMLMPSSHSKNPASSGRNPSAPLARRHQELLQLVESKGQVSVDELAQHFGVSDDTIRRDLLHLENNKVLLRTHGGAVSTALMVHRETPFLTRVHAASEGKTRIGRAAAQLIVNGGSTTFAFAANLSARRNLTVVTNNVALVSALPAEAVHSAYLIGGKYRVSLASTVGPVEFNSGGVSVDTAVLGVSGLSVNKGISTTHLDEAQRHAQMIASARRTIVVGDASKFGHDTFAQIAPLKVIDTLVTDAAPPPEFRQALTAANVALVVAPP